MSAAFALRAGISIFDLSRFMGASLAMIDRHYADAGLVRSAHIVDDEDIARRIERPQ